MPTTQLSGLASGLDWRTLVDRLIAAERVPQDRLRTAKSLTQQKTSVLEAIKTSITALQTSATALSGGTNDVFAVRAAKLADTSSGWLASAGEGTEAGSHTFQVTQLATKSLRTGVADAGNSLSATSNVSGLTIGTLPIATAIIAGEFTVNGARVTVAATDSLQDVFSRISTATGGAVTASYDPTVDKVRLSSGGEIVLGSSNDTSNLLTALGLNNNGTNEVLSPKALGVVSVSKAINNANLRTAVTAVDGSGNGSFSINGVAIAYNANTDSVSTVLSRINTSSAGVTAAYDRLADRFTLTNRTTGDTGLTVTEAPGGLLGALGLGSSSTLSRGKNAEFSVDGSATFSSASNTLESAVHGISGLSVTASSVSTQTITVSGDTAGMRSKIEDFVAKFNAVQSLIDQQTKITTGANGRVTSAIFGSNHEVSDLGASLRSKVFAAVPGLTGSVQRLESLGIDFTSGTNILMIKDGSKLDTALATNTEGVKSLFTAGTDGIATRLNTFLTQVTGTNGTIATQTTTLTNQGKTLDDQIASMDRHLAQQKSLLEKGFIQMESAQQNLQSQLSALNNAFGNNSSSNR